MLGIYGRVEAASDGDGPYVAILYSDRGEIFRQSVTSVDTGNRIIELLVRKLELFARREGFATDA